MKNNLFTPFDRTQILTFLLVGVVNTAVGAFVMFALYNLAHCSYWLSSAANYVAGGIVSFFLNKRFTFHNGEKSAVQVLLFVLNTAVCYVVAYLGAKHLIQALLKNAGESVRENVALLFGMGFYTVLNFFGQKFVVFARNEKKEAER